MKSANSLQRLRLPLAWPVYSPDMSPIEHVWDALDRCIRQRVPVPANIQQLHTANIPQATTNTLINSMRRRCVALREANGGHTRYWLVFGSCLTLVARFVWVPSFNISLKSSPFCGVVMQWDNKCSQMKSCWNAFCHGNMPVTVGKYKSSVLRAGERFCHNKMCWFK